mgnify:CR=1 FL=1
MKSEEHIHFLSDLLYQLDQLVALVREYCDEIVEPDDGEAGNKESKNENNMPF